MTMSTLINNLFFFVLSFVCVYASYMYFLNAEMKKKLGEEQETKADRLKRRLKILSRQQDDLLESAGLNKVSTFTKIESQEFGADIDSQYGVLDRVRLIMKRAGITDISLGQFLIFCGIGGIIMSIIIIHFNFLSFISGLPIGMGVGAYLVYTFLKSRADAKKMQFLQLFPDAIDMMIRGVKAGLNIGRIVKLVSMESKDPIASEYEIISQKMELGMEPEKVLMDAAEKIDLEEFRFLVVALVLQMENGGMLGEILANLSGIVRKRLELDLKLKAMSAEARMSAVVLSALPFVFAGIMALVNPNHLKIFVETSSGQTLLKIGITLFATGTFFMIRATKIKV